MNGRLNNSSAYNHDYYIKNKDKWADNKDSSSSKDNTTKPKSYYEDLGEEYFYGDWSEDKIKYVKNSPSFQKLYEESEMAYDAWNRTGLPSYYKKYESSSTRMVEESVRLGDEYDRRQAQSQNKKERASAFFRGTSRANNQAHEYRANYVQNAQDAFQRKRRK